MECIPRQQHGLARAHMWHRAGGICHNCIFHLCNLLIQAAFRSGPFKDGGADCAHNVISLFRGRGGWIYASLDHDVTIAGNAKLGLDKQTDKHPESAPHMSKFTTESFKSLSATPTLHQN